ncbi:MAG: hypothetical protein JNM62_07145 [Flavobacteriales bacterium]|nr:hypothetical protein [Flavobacteriales bacterium]
MWTLSRSLRYTFYFLLVCFAALLWAGCAGRTPTVAGEVVDCCTGRTVYEDPDLTKVPEFPGGEAAMYVWLGNRLTRPPGTESVKEAPLVQFLVGCDGVLKDIAVKVPVHPAMDSLALDAVSSMPTWVPGRIKDRQVCTFHVIPVNFD